jgi:large subunit ribosomal protein L25
MKQIQVHAQSRTAKGKAASGRLRRSGFFPAVLYSEGKPGRDIQLNEHDFVLLFRGHHAENLLMDLAVDSEKPVKALLKAMQHHPLNGRVLHADFYAISMDKKLELEIPVTLVGEAKGVAQEGGILEHVLRSVMVECLPDDLPEELQLDVSDLAMGHTLKVKDIPLDTAKYRILTDGDIVVAAIAAPRTAEEEAPAAAEEGGAAEPEVITAKKAEEEEDGKADKKEKK